MDRIEARKHIRNGAIAAFISGLMTSLMVLVAMSSDDTDSLKLFNDPAMLVDIVLIFLLACGVFFKSRAAAVAMLIYFIISKIVITVEQGAPSGLIVGLIFIYFFFQAVRGTFTYHRLEKLENPEYKSTSKWAYFLGIPFMIVFALLMLVGGLSMTGILPSTKILTGRELTATNRIDLIESNLIYKDETVIYFYSNGLASILEEGVFLTEDRVHYFVTENTGEIFSYPIELTMVSKITLLSQGDSFEPSIYRIDTEDPEVWAQVPLSIEGNLDKDFIRALKRRSPNLVVE